MRIDRRLTFIGVMLIVLSMTMATQFATTKVSYTYAIVHPSNADIRFVGSDNCSDGDDGLRVLRVTNNGTTTAQYLTINLGNWMPNSMKNYTAAFAIVNEEPFAVNITHINVSGVGAEYISIWLHGNRTTDAWSDENSVQSVSGGSNAGHDDSTCDWILAAGDGDPATMNGSSINTPWDDTSGVRYNDTTSIYAQNSTRDWVWVQISLELSSDADTSTSPGGQIWIHFKANTN
jgi:hypothetical protein